jgi:hypothetical protein
MADMLDATTLVVCGQVLVQEASNLKPDDFSGDYRQGYAAAGLMLLTYGSLLASGYSMEDIAEMAKKKVARDKDSDVKMLKDLLGDL